MSKVTINDVARLAGVSIKTVSRVVNQEPNVRPATREKVEHAIATLEYLPNQSARNLASRRARLIALLYDDPSVYELPSAGYILRLQEGALRACHAAGFELLIHPCRYREADIGVELRSLIGQTRPAGIIVAPPLSNMRKIIAAISATDTPFVRIASGLKNGKEFSVVTNDREFSAEMTRYLASLGHQRIAFITGHPGHRAVGHRFDGYRDGLEQSGLPFRKSLVIAGDNSFGAGEAAGMKLLQRDRPPTAIFAANDDMAVGVVRAADRLGVKIPGELSVAGCDDITLAQQVYPALTTIRQPLAAMAEMAARAIIESMRGGVLPRGTHVLEGKLQRRESTGPAPGMEGR
jgi:LacI family transcriptional regulator